MSFLKQFVSVSLAAVSAAGLAACTSGVVSGAPASAARTVYPPSAYEPELEDDAIPAALALDETPAAPAQIWTLRAALNVAALTCGSPALVNGYNRMLAQQKPILAQAHAAEAARYHRQFGAAGQARHDRDITRTYNHFANSEDPAAFCRDAEAVLAQLASAPTPLFGRLTRAALARLDRQPPAAVIAAR